MGFKKWTTGELNRIRDLAPQIHSGELTYYRAMHDLHSGPLRGRSVHAIRKKLYERVKELEAADSPE